MITKATISKKPKLNVVKAFAARHQNRSTATIEHERCCQKRPFKYDDDVRPIQLIQKIQNQTYDDIERPERTLDHELDWKRPLKQKATNIKRSMPNDIGRKPFPVDIELYKSYEGHQNDYEVRSDSIKQKET